MPPLRHIASICATLPLFALHCFYLRYIAPIYRSLPLLPLALPLLPRVSGAEVSESRSVGESKVPKVAVYGDLSVPLLEAQVALLN